MTSIKVPIEKSKASALFKERKNLALAVRSSCLIKGCKEQTVRCHSVSRNRLELIADKGHLLALRTSESFKEGLFNFDAASRLAEVGIGEATTFNGYCANHDSALYREIDASPFAISPNNCLTLAHRNFARQVTEHSSRLEQTQAFIAKHPPPPEPMKSMVMQDLEGREKNLKFIRTGYLDIHKVVGTSKQMKYAHLIMRTDCRLEFAISTIFFPTYSIQGERYGRDVHGSPISLTIFPEEEHSLLILTARNRNFLRSARFFESVQKASAEGYERLSSAFLLLAAIEGYPLFSKVWWNSIEEEAKTVFKEACGLVAHAQVSPDILLPGNLPILTSAKIVDLQMI